MLIQLRQIGDLLMCTPAIRAIKRAHPEAKIHVLCEHRLKWVLEGNPDVSQLLTCKRQPGIRMGWSLRKERYDAVMDCQGLPRTALAAFLSGAPKRMGFRKHGRAFFYTHPISPPDKPLYSALHKLLLLAPLGVEAAGHHLAIHPAPSDLAAAQMLKDNLKLNTIPRLVAFSPVSRRNCKRWRYESYAHVCDQLIEKKGITFLPLFGPGEEPAIESVIHQSRYPEKFLYPYTPPPFKALPALIKDCLFYFGNDNGIRHAAIIAGLPTATLFGLPNPVSWTPPSDPRHLYIWGKDCLKAVTENAVLEMLDRMVP